MADATGAQELFDKGFAIYSSDDDSRMPEAFDIFTQAADAGSVDAIYYLGVMHYNGNGAEQSFPKAF